MPDHFRLYTLRAAALAGPKGPLEGEVPVLSWECASDGKRGDIVELDSSLSESEVGRADHMGKRPAEVDSFLGNMSSMQREDTVLYATRGTTSHGNETGTNSGESSE
jgi:hypothetical protein